MTVPSTWSPALRAFVSESLDRPSIAAFVARCAAALPEGTHVLDAGAGSAPYRELFAHCRYATSDWAGSPHDEAAGADILAPLDDLPCESESFDAVITTQVLEHVPDPQAVLSELHRVLRPGGTLWLTAPLVWELHEEPYDYFRYTSHGLRVVAESAGFGQVAVEPLGGWFTMAGQLLRMMGPTTGVSEAGVAGRAVAALCFRTGRMLSRLDRYDRRRILPLGYALTARRPDARVGA